MTRFSLVVATKGRVQEIVRLLQTLETQSFMDFDVVIVDQNPEDILQPALARPWGFPLRRIRTPTQRGASRARNVGWRACGGDFVLFPDDDCWYPPDFLASARRRIDDLGVDVLAGRAATEEGRSINGRFETRSVTVSPRNVWTTSIEWMMFFRRDLLARIGGYDEGLGIGAETPWQSCEGQDIMLRALEAGARARFDPALIGHHAELDVRTPDAAMIRKGRGYARGMGFVLRKHRASWADRIYWIARPALRAAISAVLGRRLAATYSWQVAVGRAEGALGRLFAPGEAAAGALRRASGPDRAGSRGRS